MAAILDFPFSVSLHSDVLSSAVLLDLDPQNIVAVGISLLASTEAKIQWLHDV